MTASTPSEVLYRIMELLDGANIPGGTISEQVQNLIIDRGRLEAMVEAKQKQTPRECLLEMLDVDPCDTLLMLHDACLDDGLIAEAPAWFWLASNKKWPVRIDGKKWVWDHWSTKYGHSIPSPLARALTGEAIPAQVIYPSCRQAFEAIAALITDGRWKPGQKE